MTLTNLITDFMVGVALGTIASRANPHRHATEEFHEFVGASVCNHVEDEDLREELDRADNKSRALTEATPLAIAMFGGAVYSDIATAANQGTGDFLATTVGAYVGTAITFLVDGPARQKRKQDAWTKRQLRMRPDEYAAILPEDEVEHFEKVYDAALEIYSTTVTDAHAGKKFIDGVTVFDHTPYAAEAKRAIHNKMASEGEPLIISRRLLNGLGEGVQLVGEPTSPTAILYIREGNQVTRGVARWTSLNAIEQENSPIIMIRGSGPEIETTHTWSIIDFDPQNITEDTYLAMGRNQEISLQDKRQIASMEYGTRLIMNAKRTT